MNQVHIDEKINKIKTQEKVDKFCLSKNTITLSFLRIMIKTKNNFN